MASLSWVARWNSWKSDRRTARRQTEGLREELAGWQIFAITISAVIGVMIFWSNGDALEVAGPSGALLAFGVVGTVAICVMECVSELIQMFPTPNAIVEFVRVFVDEDLAWVVGIAYWYTYASIFATQIFQAAEFTRYWEPVQFYRTFFLYICSPVVIFIINMLGVWAFGVVETIGGILKISMVIGGGIYMYIIHGQNDTASENINAGFRNNPKFAANPRIATCIAIPIIAYGFLGVETVTVTAFEARDITAVKRPSRVIAYFVIAIYLFCVIGEYYNVYWKDDRLPQAYRNPQPQVEPRQMSNNSTEQSYDAIILVAAVKAGDNKIAGLLNGCMMLSALSAANTSLYVASRVLYAMTRQINEHSRLGFLQKLGSVWNQNGVPMRALCVSFISFVWLPFLRLNKGVGITVLFNIMSTSASVSCLLVWACICLAFIRYQIWFAKHKHYIKRHWPEHYRLGKDSQAMTATAHIQPAPAIIGLIGSLLIVLGFTSSTFWSARADFQKVATAYGAPIVLGLLFVAFKASARFKRGYVKLTDDVTDIQDVIEILKSSKLERAEREPRRIPWFRRRKSNLKREKNQDTVETAEEGNEREQP